MRRKALTEDTREAIRAELEQSHADRAHGPHPKPEKAAAWRRALDALEHGAIAIQVDSALYRVIGEQRPRQYLTVEDTRDAIIVELTGHADLHAASPDIADGFVLAIGAITFGALEVFAGGTLYRIVEE